MDFISLFFRSEIRAWNEMRKTSINKGVIDSPGLMSGAQGVPIHTGRYAVMLFRVVQWESGFILSVKELKKPVTIKLNPATIEYFNLNNSPNRFEAGNLA